MRIGVIFLGALLLLSACVQKGKVEIEGLDQVPKKTSAGSIESTLTSVSVVNDQLVINGSGFENVTSVKVKGPSGFDETFSIESKTDSNIVANGLSAISFAVGSTFDLILSNASAAATYQVTFTLQDGAVTAAKLDDMGAGDGDVLIYNQSLSTWEPSPLSSISYRGSWDANSNTPALSDGGGTTSPTAGDFYVVSNSGSTSIDGTSTWNAGDWIIYDAVNTKWDRIANTSSVSSVFGRQGSVTAQEGDYTIDQLGDVDTTTTTPGDGQVLKWDSATSTWVVGDDLSSGGAGSVTSTEIQDGTIVDADINTISQSKITNLTTDLAAKLPLDGSSPMGGILDMGTNAITNVGNVDGVDVSALNSSVSTNTSDISTNTTNIATKADEPGSTCGAGNKLQWDGTSFTCVADIDTNTNADTLCAAGEYLDGDGTCKTASTGNGDFMADGSVPMTGNLDFGYNKARFKSDNTNYAELIAPSGLGATYSLTLPADAGTTGDVLSVDASGNLQWSTSGSGSVTSVTGSAPIASSGGNNPDISISQANGSTDGYLSSTDWNTFNDKQDAITTGSTSQYLRGDLSLSSFSTDVAGSVLSGFVTGADSTVTNTDTVETAVEKIQGQINGNNTAIAGKQDDLAAPADGTQYLDGNETWQTLNTDAVTEATNLYFTESRVLSSLLSGYSVGTDAALADGDTLLQALAKLEAQIQADASNAFLKDGSVAMTGDLDFGYNKARFKSDNANYAELIAPSGLGATYSLTLPPNAGTSGDALSVDASGNLQWTSSLSPSGSAGGDLSGSYPNPGIASGVIVDGDINASANITASKLGTGAVSNTEFNYLDGVTSSIQTQLDGKEPTLTKGDLTESTSSVLNITGGTGAIIGTGTSIEVNQANSTTSGYLSSTDWNMFNDKVDINGDTMTGPLNLPTDGLNVGTNQVTTSSGNFGLGLPSPLGILHAERTNTGTTDPVSKEGQTCTLPDGSSTNCKCPTGYEHVDGDADTLYDASECEEKDDLFIVRNGNVGIGTDSPEAEFEIAAPLKNKWLRVNTNNKYPNLSIRNYLNGDNGHPHFSMGNYGGTEASPTVTPSSSILGTIIAHGFDGTDDLQSGRISFRAEDDFSTGYNPTSLELSVGNGTGGYTTRMEIQSDGNVGIGTSTPSSRLEVNGVITAGGIKTTTYKVQATSLLNFSSTNNTTSYDSFPELTQTFTLNEATTVRADYKITAKCTDTSNDHLVTALFIDGSKKESTLDITGGTQYWGNEGTWTGELAAGTYTIDVRYRTPCTAGDSDPADDWAARSLTINVLSKP